MGDHCEKNETKFVEFFKYFYFEIHFMKGQLDSKKYGQKPTRKIIKWETSLSLEYDRFKGGIIPVRINKIENEDSFFQLGQSEEWNFYDNGQMRSWNHPLVHEEALGIRMFGSYYFTFEVDQIKHERKIYSVLDLFGDFGGFMQVILLVGWAFMSSITSHMFQIKALQKLYRAQTADDKLFALPKGEKIAKKLVIERKLSRQMSKREKRAIKKNRVIKFGFYQTFTLFITNVLGDCLPCMDQRKNKLRRLYSIG